MMLRLRKLMLAVISAFIVGIAVDQGVAQNSVLPISLPVHGHYAFTGFIVENVGKEQLFSVDTFTGGWILLAENDRLLASPMWSTNGDRIAYLNSLNTTTILNVTTGIPDEVPVLGRNNLFYPQGWSGDDATILYRSFDFAAPSTEFTLDLFDIGTGSMTTISSFIPDQVVSMPLPPLPPGVSEVRFIRISQAHLNPQHTEWIALQIEGLAGERGTSINVVFNRQTGQMLSLDQLFGNDRISPTPVLWSPDGQYLILRTSDENRISRNRIITLHNTDGNWSLEVVKSAEGPVVVDWLAVSDMLIAITGDENNNSVLQIAQIIGENWYSTEFFRIPRATFPTSGFGDFHLTANSEERYALSCLFDQALPTRLAIGTRARVNFTNGTPLRLRTEPSLDAAEIQQMPEGTEFNVIGGPACENADLYYRFWQVELDDGTVGWAAEANNASYFIEQVPTVTCDFTIAAEDIL